MEAAAGLHANSLSDIVKGRPNGKRKLPSRRVCNKLVEVVCVPARVGDILEMGVEGRVEGEEVSMCLSESKSRDFLLDQAPRERRIGDPDSFEVQVDFFRVLV